MSEPTRPPGETTVSADVLIDIVRLATLSVPGVKSLAPVPGGVNRLFLKGGAEGVQLSIHGEVVDAAVYVILDMHHEVLKVSHLIQQKVGRAISEMVGMEVGVIDVHVEDMIFESQGEEE